ncbi:uncharacterized protein LOC131858975 [Cryptomeria japonica]|uniref:uncharacterized protein LOC131858975 n=1 Tax=Cryptomeria japonica TaxID=3369 RepID=UPI0027DA7BC0|nr:uncharacterized protein LOC131858975 [Cryptomeria japonica]
MSPPTPKSYAADIHAPPPAGPLGACPPAHLVTVPAAAFSSPPPRRSSSMPPPCTPQKPLSASVSASPPGTTTSAGSAQWRLPPPPPSAPVTAPVLLAPTLHLRRSFRQQPPTQTGGNRARHVAGGHWPADYTVPCTVICHVRCRYSTNAQSTEGKVFATFLVTVPK